MKQKTKLPVELNNHPSQAYLLWWDFRSPLHVKGEHFSFSVELFKWYLGKINTNRSRDTGCASLMLPLTFLFSKCGVHFSFYPVFTLKCFSLIICSNISKYWEQFRIAFQLPFLFMGHQPNYGVRKFQCIMERNYLSWALNLYLSCLSILKYRMLLIEI